MLRYWLRHDDVQHLRGSLHDQLRPYAELSGHGALMVGETENPGAIGGERRYFTLARIGRFHSRRDLPGNHGHAMAFSRNFHSGNRGLLLTPKHKSVVTYTYGSSTVDEFIDVTRLELLALQEPPEKCDSELGFVTRVFHTFYGFRQLRPRFHQRRLLLYRNLEDPEPRWV